MKTIAFIFTGFLLGIIFSGVMAVIFMPGQMILTNESRLGFDETIDMINEKTDGNKWAVLKEWDLTKRILNAGYDDAPVVRVVELCNAEYTHDVLKNEEDLFISAIMPYRISVYELGNGKVMISRMNMDLMRRLFSRNIQMVMGKAAVDDKNILKDIIK